MGPLKRRRTTTTKNLVEYWTYVGPTPKRRRKRTKSLVEYWTYVGRTSRRRKRRRKRTKSLVEYWTYVVPTSRRRKRRKKGTDFHRRLPQVEVRVGAPPTDCTQRDHHIWNSHTAAQTLIR